MAGAGNNAGANFPSATSASALRSWTHADLQSSCWFAAAYVLVMPLPGRPGRHVIRPFGL
jgi:hypothetical protein